MTAIRLKKMISMKKLIELGAKVDYRNKVCSDTFGGINACGFTLGLNFRGGVSGLTTHVHPIRKRVLHRHAHEYAQSCPRPICR